MKSHEIKKVEKFPYPVKHYFRRGLWIVFQFTLWKVLWHRMNFSRMGLLKLFGAKTSFKSMAFGSTKIQKPWDLEMGAYVTLGPRVHVYNLGKIKIGNNSIISQDVYLCGGTHDYTDSKLPLLRKDIVIGDNVWIGAGAFIGPGVVIGDGAVIGARAVLMKNAEPWSIYIGNPARKIKERKIDK